MWLGTLEGLDRFDGREMRKFQPDPISSQITCAGPLLSAYVDRDDNVWAGSNAHGACVYNIRTGVWRAYFMDVGAAQGVGALSVRDFYQDDAGTLWAAISAGLAYLEPGSETPQFLRANPDRPDSLGDDDLYAIAADQAGMLWLATRGGVDAFDPTTQRFTHYRHDPADPDSLSSNRAFDILVDAGGAIWIATWDGGLNRLDPSSGRIQHFRQAAAPETGASEAGASGALSSDQVIKLFADGAGRLWVGTYGGGLNLFDPQTQQFTHYRAVAGDANSLSHDNVMALYEDRAGQLWIGTEGGGVSILNLHPQPFTVYHRSGGELETLPPAW